MTYTFFKSAHLFAMNKSNDIVIEPKQKTHWKAVHDNAVDEAFLYHLVHDVVSKTIICHILK